MLLLIASSWINETLKKKGQHYYILLYTLCVYIHCTYIAALIGGSIGEMGVVALLTRWAALTARATKHSFTEFINHHFPPPFLFPIPAYFKKFSSIRAELIVCMVDKILMTSERCYKLHTFLLYSKRDESNAAAAL